MDLGYNIIINLPLRLDVLQGFAITQMIVIMKSRLNKSMNKPITTHIYKGKFLESNTNIIFLLHTYKFRKNIAKRRSTEKIMFPTVILV